MTIETYVMYGITIVFTIISLFKSKQKTKKGLIKGFRSFLKVLPILLPLFLMVGILLTLITPEFIFNLMGEGSGLFGYVIAMTVGSLTFLSPFVAYPLGAELLSNGAAHPQIAGFLVTLMSVGIIYFPMEVKYFNKKAAIYRNLVSLIGAIIVVFIVMVIHS